MRLAFVVVLVFLMASIGFTQQSDDWFQGKPIVRITFDGLVNVRVSDLEGITQPFVGRTFDDHTFWDILGRLYALEFFETISPSAIMADAHGNEVLLRFTVTERPMVSRINFTGNSNLRRNELLDTILLSPNDIVTDIRLRLDERAIVERYLERGFPDVRVRSEVLPGRDNAVVVVFHIEEGEMIAIEGFVFEGNTAFTSRTLQRQLSLRPRSLFNSGAFQESRLIADRHTLVQYYRDRGFLNANVIDIVREIRRDDRGNNLMTITFKIYEGTMFTFGGITFEGNRILSTEQLSAQVTSRVGDVANERRLHADLMRISDLYFEHGYIFNRIEPIPTQDLEAGTISFHIHIIERGRAHIENIIVSGNQKTRDYVILREIPLVPGDVFSKARVMEGLRNLHNLQYFSAISPETPPGSTDFLMDLIINVEEMPTTDVQFGLTFSGSADPDTFPISLMARWNDRNFMGSGNMIGADLTVAPETQALTLQYTERWMMGLPLSASFDFTAMHMNRRAAMQNFPPFFHGDEPFAFPDGFSSFEEYEAAFRIPPDQYLMPYNQWRVSLGAGTGYRWMTHLGVLGLGGGVRLGMMLNSYDSDLFRPFDPILRENNNRWSPSTSIWSSFSLDRRDLFFDPSSGYYVVQRLGYYGIFPFEREHYIRTDTRAEWFYTLIDVPVTDTWNFKAVFGIHTGLSFILRQPFFDRPYIEEASRLAVDGMFIGRGWMHEFRRKGNALWLNWVEIRIPVVPGILAWDFFFDAAGIKPTPGALFTNFFGDDGSLAGSDTFFMRFSFGGGFRFTIPQFPFRFSIARRFLIRDGAAEWQRGGIGNMFDFVVSFAMTTY